MPSKITLYQEGEDDVPTPAVGAKTLFLGTDDAFKTKDSGGVVGSIEINLSNATPQPVGTASAGTSTSASRANHRHAHGNQGGGSLHSLATTSTSGFMSAADKTNLNTLSANDLDITTYTTSTTLTLTLGTALADASGGALTFTLPAASTAAGKTYTLKKIDSSANAATFDGDASETIDDATTQSVSAQYECLTIQCDGVEWWIRQRTIAS